VTLNGASPGKWPGFNHAAIARLYSALAGGNYADEPERDLADRMEATFPGTKRLVTKAREFHARAAEWAAEDGCEGIVFGAAGFPGPGEPLHLRAMRVNPAMRFAYLDPDEGVTLVNQVLLADLDADREGLRLPWTVAAVQASVRDARALLELPVIGALGKPLSVHAQSLVHFMPDAAAREMAAGYGRELSPGSSLVLSLRTPDATPAGEKFLSMLAETGAPAYAHTAESVRSWLEDAGMKIVGRVTDVRAWRPGGGWAGIELGRRAPARIIEAVARVR
jgi:hypothetical protein